MRLEYFEIKYSLFQLSEISLELRSHSHLTSSATPVSIVNALPDMLRVLLSPFRAFDKVAVCCIYLWK